MSTKYIEKAEKLIKQHKYLMTTLSYCPDVRTANAVWSKYGVLDKIQTVEFDTMKDRTEAIQLRKAFGQIAGRDWVPTIFFNGKRLGTEEDLVKWDQDGELKTILKREGLL